MKTEGTCAGGFQRTTAVRVTVRDAGPADSETAYHVKKMALIAQRGNPEKWDDVEQRRLHALRFNSQAYKLIYVEEEPVGVMAVVVMTDCIQVNQFFILPAMQGRGIGHGAMRQLLETADRGRLPVRLQVTKNNRRAIGFYAVLGFVGVDGNDTHYTLERRAGAC